LKVVNSWLKPQDYGYLHKYATQLEIKLPKSFDMLRQKGFIQHAKEQMHLKLFAVVNNANNLSIDF
jgi:hypothetical protein